MSTAEDITFKKIVFMGNDSQHSYETSGGNVIVVGSTGTHDHGSSKVKLKNIVDYKWEVKQYVGRLIAIHIGGQYVAYSIKVNSKDGRPEGMVRVVNPKTGQRALIRGMTNEVLDIQFAHIKSQILLASIEDIALHIHTIESVGDSIICALLMKIEDSIPGHVPKYDKINWCPYVPETESESDNYIGKLLVWTRGKNYQCYNIPAIVETYGLGTHLANDITEGALKHSETSTITDAVLSPDGTTLAIAFEDGNIRFYQAYFHANDESPRLLHQWVPHNGKPVSSLFFLDDHSKYSEDNSLWKYAVTTSNNNTEIKVWCCATWECTQTIKFQSTGERELYFKAEIDPTSSYLVLTDTTSRCLYVLQIIQGNNDDPFGKDENGDSKKAVEASTDSNSTKKETPAFIKSISEFPLSSPILSFGIIDATVRKYKCAYNDVYLLEQLDDYDEESLNRYCVVIHLYLVQPKSVQECHVLYQPSLSIEAEVSSSISNLSEEAVDRDTELNEVKASAGDTIVSNATSTPNTTTTELLISPTALIKSDSSLTDQSNHSTNTTVNVSKVTPITLMTPDSFHSSGKISPEDPKSNVSKEVFSTILMLAGEKLPGNVNTPIIDNKMIEEQEKKKLAQQLQQAAAEKIKSDSSGSERNSAGSGKQNTSQVIIPPMPPSTMLAGAGVSGGSSPSREVQEILSKDSDMMDEFYDEIIPGADDSDDNVDAADGNENDEADDDEDAEKNSSPDDEETDVAANNDEAGFSRTEKQNVSQPQSNGIRKSSNTDWPNVPDFSTLSKNYNNLLQKTSTPINDINSKLDQLLDIIQSQNCQITELRNEVCELKKGRPDSSSGNTEAVVNKLEFRLSKMIDEYLIRYDREHNKKLESFLAGREKQNRELRDAIIHAITPLICNQLSGQLSNTITNEIQKHVMPIIAGKLEGIKTNIQSDIAQKITITDHVIKENIAHICRSKDTLEVFGNAVVNGVKSGMHQTYTDTLRKVILPAYEKANAELFKQLYETFNEGTISYSNQIMAYTKAFEPLLKELAKFMHSVPEQLQDISVKTVNSCMDKVGGDITKDLKAIQANMLKTVQTNIKSEIQKGFESQAATLEDSVLMAVRSQAQTPAPGLYDTQEQIKYLLYQGQINKAFHQALLANDLNLVEFTLSKADYNQVFNPCPLEQTVLLSLIQQISADMSNHNELKHKYLSNAILNLNLHDPVTKEHSPNVLRELQVNCQNYIMANPQTPLSSSVRMLIMAIQGLGLNLI